MKDLDLKPQPDYKCEHCGKGGNKHRAFDKGCPIGKNGPYSKVQFFKATDKLTAASNRAIKEYEQSQQREQERIANFLKEKQKIRAMTFQEVVTTMVEVLANLTKLGVRVDYDKREDHAQINLTTLDGRIDLGHTSVFKATDGSFHVGGTYAGCFMANSGANLQDKLDPLFKALEERANKEKE